MADFDKVTVSNNSKELIALDANVGEFDNITGGQILCKDQFGNTVISLRVDAEASISEGVIYIHNGALQITNAQGKLRSILHSGDELDGEDGGTILLISHDDLQSGSTTQTSAIMLNAQERTVFIRNANGKAIVEVGTELNDKESGGITLHDSKGNKRIIMEAAHQPLRILSPNGALIASIGSDGTLKLGGGGTNGNISLNSNIAKEHIRLDASTMKFIIKDDNGQTLIDIGGSSGSITTKGNITVNGNIKHQEIAYRNRRIKVSDKSINLFDAHHRGAFVVELMASYSIVSNSGSKRGSFQAQWVVFTHNDAGMKLPPDIYGGITINSSDSGPLWNGDAPALLEENGKVVVKIPDLPVIEGKTIVDNNFSASLSVRASYGNILDF